jgi:poly-gamma-glutamate synthesis protein (capsule biosynthesis protein)
VVLAVTTTDLGPNGAGAQATADDPAPLGVPDPDAAFTATMVGDLMFGRHVQRVTDREGYDAPLRHVAPLLEGDYVSGNLEQVISDREQLPEADKLIHLRSPTETVEALVDAGFTTLSLANNHSMDYGIPGLRDTIDALDAAGLNHAGAGVDLDAAVRTDLQEHGELTVATLSFTDVFVEGFIARSFQGGALQAEPDVFVPLIQNAAAEADLVIAHFHWGEEYDIAPGEDQRENAEIAAAAGADIIVGHHPHVLMPVERIGETLVIYSLGNFVFDQGWSRTRESAIARYTLGEDGTARVELVPVYIREATPQVLSGPLATYRRERIFQRLRGDGLEWSREDGMLVTELDHGHILDDEVAP